MTDDQYPGDDQPPVPPVAGGGDDPTLPGGVDPTIVQPVQPHYTTGPGEPPERVGGGAGGAGGAGGVGGGIGGGMLPPSGSGRPERPAWLLPAAGGLAAGLVVALIAFFVLTGDDGDDGGDELASTDSTIPTVVETTVPPDGGGIGTEPPATTIAPGEVGPTETTVAPDDGGDGDAGTNTTVASGGGDGGEDAGDGGASTGGDSADGGDGAGDGGDGDGGESTDPCADGYTEVAALPFGLCSQGDVVADAQFTLSEFVAIDVDGFYGPTSFSAVQEIQRNLGVEPDGIVSAELIDLLIGSVPATEFTVATPGTVRVVDREYPITRTCRTIPLAGFTADYVVISYVFVTDFGVEVVDRWFEEGLATGAFYFGQEIPVTELDQGFGLEIVEGDSLVTISVNPVDSPSDSCVGLVTEFDNDGAQSRLYSVLNVCAAGDGPRLLLSENATVDITMTGDDTPTVRFVSGTAQPFLFGEDPDAVLVDDGSTSTVNATIDAGDGVRSYLIQYPSSPSGSC